jgi:hypothetical protein
LTTCSDAQRSLEGALEVVIATCLFLDQRTRSAIEITVAPSLRSTSTSAAPCCDRIEPVSIAPGPSMRLGFVQTRVGGNGKTSTVSGPTNLPMCNSCPGCALSQPTRVVSKGYVQYTLSGTSSRFAALATLANNCFYTQLPQPCRAYANGVTAHWRAFAEPLPMTCCKPEMLLTTMYTFRQTRCILDMCTQNRVSWLRRACNKFAQSELLIDSQRRIQYLTSVSVEPKGLAVRLTLSGNRLVRLFR